jgi:hypothetical protein
MFICYVIVLCLLPVTLQATVYIWQDDSRHKYFSDRPRDDDAMPVMLPPVQTYRATQNETTLPVADSSVTNSEYRFHWQNPIDRQTIHNNSGQFVARVTLEPTLAESDYIQLWIDDMAYSSLQKTLTFQVNDLNRGTHELSLVIVNQQQEVKQRSKPITIYLHRAAVK